MHSPIGFEIDKKNTRREFSGKKNDQKMIKKKNDPTG